MRLFLAVVWLPLALAAPAGAAEVGVERGVLTFSAAAGEANDVRVTVAGTRLVVEDAGAALIAGEGCAPAGEAVRCTAGRMVADLGDGDDRFRGGAERDRVRGQPGSDQLHGGGGHDYLIDRSPEDDVLRGGAGPDLVAAIYGADVLRGGAEPDILVGLGAGASLFGGAGPDQLAAAPGAGTIDCGAASDLINPLGLGRTVPASCELFEFETLETGHRARAVAVGAGRVRVPVPDLCGVLEVSGSCAVRVEVIGGGRGKTRRGAVELRAPVDARAVGVRYSAPEAGQELEVRLRVVNRRS